MGFASAHCPSDLIDIKRGHARGYRMGVMFTRWQGMFSLTLSTGPNNQDLLSPLLLPLVYPLGWASTPQERGIKVKESSW